MDDPTLAIEVSGVHKAFGQVKALNGVDLAVAPGSLTALLGPNGAGKTTLVRIIATLSRADAGRVRVLGFDVAAQPRHVRERIGLTGQFAGLDDALSGRDNLILIGRLAGLRRRTAAGRAGELAATSKPSTRTRPASGRDSVAMIRTSVVLPAPFGPRSAVSEPWVTVRSTPFSATTSPKALRTPATSMAGVRSSIC